MVDRSALEWEHKRSPWTPTPSAQTPSVRAPMTPMASVQHEPPEGEVICGLEKSASSRQSLWVASNEMRKGKKTWHRVTKAGWKVPMAEWGSACGWNFTKNPDRVSMAVALLFGQTRCQKCPEVMKARDRVREGHVLADFIQKESGTMFGQ